VQIVSGATILGNGSVALILDPERLVQDAMREEANGKGFRAVQPPGGSRQDGVGGTAPAAKGSAGPSASARM
jgi:chemotaxis protein histidine kinase CheA